VIRTLRSVCLAAIRDAIQPWWMKLALLMLGALILGVLAGFRINVSESLPLGIYRVVGDGRSVERGSIVVVCLPGTWSRFALERAILGRGDCPGGTYGLGKIVVAVEGDEVIIFRDRLLIGATLMISGAILERDEHGPIPHHPWGRHTLRRGQIWLYSCHPSAFDSRYFGPVNEEAIVWTVRPVLTKGAWLDRSCRGSRDDSFM
jgi:conjugative transfer signal peptidase TraF